MCLRYRNGEMGWHARQGPAGIPQGDATVIIDFHTHVFAPADQLASVNTEFHDRVLAQGDNKRTPPHTMENVLKAQEEGGGQYAAQGGCEDRGHQYRCHGRDILSCLRPGEPRSIQNAAL